MIITRNRLWERADNNTSKWVVDSFKVRNSPVVRTKVSKKQRKQDKFKNDLILDLYNS